MVLLFPFKKKIALLPVFISLFVILPEWSKGPDLRSGVFARVGSNPTDDMGVRFLVRNLLCSGSSVG